MTQTNRKVVVLSDTMEEMDNLQHLLKGEFGALEKTLIHETAARLIRQNAAAVLIVAFQNIKIAERSLLSIFEEFGHSQRMETQRLLLCKAVETEWAYRLYKNQLVDDFVADRPLYDSNRLKLSVLQALDRAEHQRLSDNLAGMTERITTDMRELDHFVARILDSGDQKTRQAADMFRHFTRKLVGELETLDKGIHEVDSANRGGGQLKKVLDQGLQRMRKTIADEGGAIDDHLNETAQWLVQLSRERDDPLPQSQADSAPEPGIGPRVLIVDDDDFYREAVVAMLEDSDFEIEAVDHGGTAIERIQQDRPDIILLDYKMPGIDGLEVLDLIRGDAAMKDIPVIMLTGVSSRLVVDQSIARGARDFIVKPGNRDTIIKKINEVLARR